MTEDKRKEIENSAKFKFFLLKFGVKSFNEYLQFTEEEKKICLEEFEKYAKERRKVI